MAEQKGKFGQKNGRKVGPLALPFLENKVFKHDNGQYSHHKTVRQDGLQNRRQRSHGTLWQQGYEKSDAHRDSDGQRMVEITYRAGVYNQVESGGKLKDDDIHEHDADEDTDDLHAGLVQARGSGDELEQQDERKGDQQHHEF